MVLVVKTVSDSLEETVSKKMIVVQILLLIKKEESKAIGPGICWVHFPETLVG